MKTYRIQTSHIKDRLYPEEETLLNSLVIFPSKLKKGVKMARITGPTAYKFL